MMVSKTMRRKLLFLVSVIFLMTACTVKGPEVGVRPPEVILDPPVKVETDTHTYPQTHPGPRHCPPGHAKKGWC